MRTSISSQPCQPSLAIKPKICPRLELTSRCAFEVKSDGIDTVQVSIGSSNVGPADLSASLIAIRPAIWKA